MAEWTIGERRDGHAASPATDLNLASIPDVEGKDVGRPTPPWALAQAIEAENTKRVQKLLSLGASPADLQILAIQTRIEAVIATMPPHLLPQFEVTYEMALAKHLDDVLAQATKPKLHLPGEG